MVDLGITVDSNMRFDKHINKMLTKAHQCAAHIYRCLKTDLVTMYKIMFSRLFLLWIV